MAGVANLDSDYYKQARERFRERLQLSDKRKRMLDSPMACGCDCCEHALPEVAGGSEPAAQIRVAGIRFPDSSRTYYIDPRDEWLDVGDQVLVDTDRGTELGTVVIAPYQVIASQLSGEVKPIVRKATDLDLERAEHFRALEGEALKIFTTKIRDRELPMKPLRGVFTPDGTRLTLYFSSASRVDFRDLVRDLAKHFRCRIELRQVGARDEARLVGSLGKCGRPLCCSTWLGEYADVSMTMARNQSLPANPEKISGACGKLLCCLSFEDDFYREVRRRLPRLGQQVETEQGSGYIKALNILRDTATVELDEGGQVELVADDIQIVNDKRSRRKVRRDKIH